MSVKKLISLVEQGSGMSHEESKDALENLVESLSVHLNEPERRKFAAQLPEQLHDIALTVYATPENSTQDLVVQFIQNQHIEARRAIKQITAAWAALKGLLSEGEIAYLRSIVPVTSAVYLC